MRQQEAYSRRRAPAQRLHGDQRPLRAQAGRPRDRGHRLPPAGRQRNLRHREPRRRPDRARVHRSAASTCPRPSATTTRSSSRFEKRLPNNWYLNVGYTWSRLYGNYSGLTQSDENGRTSPNVGRLFDYPAMMFDQHGSRCSDRWPPIGRTSSRRSSSISSPSGRASASTSTSPAACRSRARSASSRPATTRFSTWAGAATAGRTCSRRPTSSCSTRFSLGQQRLQFSFNVFNLFNQDAAVSKYSTYQRTTSSADQRSARSTRASSTSTS